MQSFGHLFVDGVICRFGYYPIHTIRYRCLNCKRRPEGRMDTCDFPRVEHGTGRPKTVVTTCFSPRIEIIADNWVVDVLEMNTDLMRPPRFRKKLNQRNFLFRFPMNHEP